ncbi:hypothetical protein GCM10010112_63310 [Actinoplanes lobatus]|uniref:Uncharacterized protein n=1 Tax=Actinoplanes lobatus TaxID=113568 RepID=A0A7W7HKA7_9ACTN|nr:hypothetical protein [Actinoplanes lobatus]MBB4752123.1 hypothetical protein [Actinoplanes lobatus]GGN84199.1 hypothetical protein GCM10010112_63310 [Actinoplanes lobatus]GIE44108.1 hypothetical protein Alo02nite_70060 [Actinoplanes lobatus]
MIGKLSRSVLVASVVLPWAVACTSSPTEGLSGDEVVAAYVDAIQQGDRSRLLELNNPAFDQVSEIDQKIAAIGDREWINPRTTWLTNPITGAIDVARISATDTHGTKIVDQIAISSIDGSWYVNLGTRTPQPGDPIPASTTRLETVRG